MELTKGTVFSVMAAATGLVAISLSIGLPWFVEGSAHFYLYDSNGNDAMQTLMSLVIVSIITGWLFLLSSLLSKRTAAIVLGWLSIAAMAISVFYALGKMGEIDDDLSPWPTEATFQASTGWIAALAATIIMSIGVYVHMEKYFREPRPAPSEDWPLP